MAGDVSLRETYGHTLAELGRQNRDIVVLDADLCPSTMTQYFGAEFPERFFNVGIAEQDMIGIAAGLAASGKIPFASTFAVFAPGRCFDQIRVSVAQARLNVKIVVTHAGVTVGEDGASHQALEDLSLICSLPGFTVIVPADAIETDLAVKAVAAHDGPCYIRLCRPKLPTVNDDSYRFEIGKAVTLRPGKDVTVIAIGVMVAAALEAAAALAGEGIDCRVINMPTLKPFDEAAIIRAAADTGAVVAAEEHQAHGGLGSIVARVVAKNRPVPMEFVAIRDVFGQSGKPAELLAAYGLTSKDIIEAVRAAVKRKA
ncbi:MAG TPA: transketolase family protein [Dehalococcoidales bacterium]|nr:transketolase family protein [Dehalococcoidales bacterium]